MKYTWFKYFHEARTDNKLDQLDDAQFRVFIKLLGYSSEQPVRGTIKDIPDEVLAAECAKGDVPVLLGTISLLETLRIVETYVSGVSCVSGVSSGVSSRFIVFRNFEKRQGDSVSRNKNPSTERVRKFRQAKKLSQSETLKRDETQMKHDETQMKRPLDRELEREEEIPPDGGGNSRPPSHVREAGAIAADAAAAVEEARVRFGDKIAAVVQANAADIDATLGGRFELYLAALERSRSYTKPIAHLHGFAITLASRYAVTGIPPPPVAVEPAAAPAARETATERRTRERKEQVAIMKARDQAEEEERNGHP